MAKATSKTASKSKGDSKASKAEAAGPKMPKPKIRKRNQVKKGPHGGSLLVLVEDVPHLGKVGDQVEVKPGYARNYLIPNGMAIVPTPHDLKMLEKHQIKVVKAREARIADLKVLAEQLSRLPTLTIEAIANDEGHLYGSIGPIEISKQLKGKNLIVEPEMIKLEHPIKEANTLNPVPLSLGYGIEAAIQVLVVALQQAAPAKK
jgi:large subunit ribosomal protein L9